MRSCVGDSHCPLCYSNVKGRSNWAGHRGYRAPPPLHYADVRSFMQRPPTSRLPAHAPAPNGPDAMQESFPLLYAHMMDETWDDGAVRVTSTLLVFTEAGRFKAMLRDRSCQLVAFVTGWTWLELLTTIEEGLRGAKLDWRAERKGSGRSR